MMVSKDTATMRETGEASGKRPGIGWPIAISLATIFLAAFVAGYLDGTAEAGHPIMPTPLGAGLVVLAGAVAMGLYLRRVGAFWRDWSRRKRLYWASLIGAGLIGALAATLLHSGRVEVGGDPFFSNSALSPTIAIILALLWIGGLAVTAFFYQRVIDDHEERAYLWAGLAGFYAFIIPAPAWWALARASILPPVDAMLLVLFAVIANAAVYFWLKFR